uniref:Ubiquinone biosynthesis O-methyltransferase n=1 Tax=Vitiosangium cumulatum TaxID=1867796 RepID=A0A7D4XJS1_9BACT|nr:ubiquinone biosynthesis O-methyltransferase [Vitiosangium cumulatum]
MGITMSPQDYATAFRLLAASARHPENIGQAVEERILPRLPKQRSLLDVGAGSGKVAERLAPHFGSLTLLEPNQNQIAGLELDKAKIHLEPLERYQSPERYELVVCSHVLYHVPLAEWGGFIDRLLSFVRPGGYCVIVMAAARGPTYRLCRDFSETMLFGEPLLTTMQQKRLPHEVLETMSGFVAKTFEEMYTLCRFFVLEGCYTAEQLAAMSGDEVRRLDEKIRAHAERCRGADGVYRLEQDEDLIIIPKT